MTTIGRLCFALMMVVVCGSLFVAADDGLRVEQVAADGANFYVAPDGHDDDPGTVDKPFRSLSRARDAVRQLKRNPRAPGPIIVMLRGGTYRPSLSVVFSDRDSGSKESPIVYMAYPGEHPVLSGGRRVTGWKVHQNQIMAAVLPTEENQYYRFRAVFLNGRRQTRARHPNYDSQHPWTGGWAFIESTVPAEAKAPVTFKWEPEVFSRTWSKPELGEIFVIPGLAWTSHFIPIRDADHGQRTLTVTRRLTQGWEKLTTGNRFRVENLLEELDQPGEWCFDSESTTLYFWPPERSLRGAEVTVPVLDRLIELRSTAGQPVRHLHFHGLTFTQTLTIFPNPIPKHPDYVDCNRPNSGGYSFYMENTQHCTVENCRFDQVGGDAIRLHGHSAHNRIVRNEIIGAGAQGICLADLEFWPYDFPPIWHGNEQRFRSMSSRLPWAIANVISDNHIHHIGLTDNFGGAIHFHGMNCQDNVIAHNLIHDTPHHAIYFSMGFGRNVIEYNDIHTVCLAMADAGGVYCNRWCILKEDDVLKHNNVIRYNRIRNVHGVHPLGREAKDPAAMPSHERIQMPYYTWGIYFDNSPRRAQVYGNLTVGNVWGGIFVGGGYAEPADCLVENNILVESSVYQFDMFMGGSARGNRFVRNIVYYKNTNASLLRAKPNSTGGIKQCDYNLYWPASGQPLKLVGVPGESWDTWREMGFDAHSVVADPLFVDPENGDFRLKPDSPAHQLDFKPIPFERIGPRSED